MATKPHHHPADPGQWTPPTTDVPGYILGTLAPAGFGRADFYVALISRKTACDLIIRHHYSHRVVSNSYLHLGAWVDGVLRGVLQFGYAMNPVTGARKIVEGTEVHQYMELNRMWFDDVAPRNTESQALSYAIKLIRRICPMVAWVQSFADERCGGWGVVYQAANFHYFGHHTKDFYELDGEFYHSMHLTLRRGKGGGRGEYLRNNLARATRHRLRQFRYIYMIKPAWLRRCKVQPLPYPKPGNPLPTRRRRRAVPAGTART
ncbi:hypothetical protein [Pseudomonas sp. RIT-PI-AD]|uniref:Mom family adenine methylcarbamoylation protein n=1 Tax=Pseudomonas sp. RIT-PI-AD TaxID=3035294 RepID=UPI0021DB3016|nr:hypothetical protein [Pseudomonas sp. RIT-PI-AD]